MKKYNALYYLLFILLVMGAFAAMAQNAYGLKIMGAVAFSFGFLFGVQLIQLARKKKERNFFGALELTGLFLIATVFGLRIFYIRFQFIDELFAAAGLILVFFYLRKMIILYKLFHKSNITLALVLLAFHLSIILFLFSLILVPFAPRIAEFINIAAFVFVVLFVIGAFMKRKTLVEGKNVSAFTTVTRFKDHSIIVVTLCLLLSLFVGLNQVGILPAVYTDQFPQSYYKLVNDATSGKEKPVNGRYRYQEFSEKYDEVLKNKKIR